MDSAYELLLHSAAVMGLPAGTAELKRHTRILMEFASRTISPVPDTDDPSLSESELRLLSEIMYNLKDSCWARWAATRRLSAVTSLPVIAWTNLKF